MFCLCLPECTECEPGFFSKSINSPCKKWKEYVHPSWFQKSAQQWTVFLTLGPPFILCRCKFGANITGTRISDVICNELPQTDTSADASPTLGRAVSSDTVNEPEVHTQTRGLLTTSATTITSPTRQITHPNAKVQPSSPSSTTDSFGKAHPAVPLPHNNKKTKMK